MNDMKTLNQRYETIGWGSFFVLIGLDFLVPGLLLPYGIGMLGIGTILLWLNLARALSHIPTRGFATLLGLLALIEGAAAVARAWLGIQIGLPLFAIFLVGTGVFILIRVMMRTRNGLTNTPE